MKKIFYASITTLCLTSCGSDCSNYPVGPYHRGTYQVSKEDKSVHFIGSDENGNRVDIIIPPEYYDITFTENDYELNCHCRYAGE
jgi:hypothetical protein